MPNRILKDSVCTSDNIDALTVEAETFFYRLLVQCDDYGRMDARPAVLRARCFPLRLDKITEKHVSRFLKELVDAGLVGVYTVEGHPYLHLLKWDKHQQVRAQRSKYPAPEAADSEPPPVISDDINGNQPISDAPVIQSNPIQSNSGASAPTGDPLKELAAVFENFSGVKLDDIPKKSQGSNFWNPLANMVKMANGSASEILQATVRTMRARNLSISSPNSCLKTFTALHGERKVRHVASPTPAL
jgi:hypothetical protein